MSTQNWPSESLVATKPQGKTIDDEAEHTKRRLLGPTSTTTHYQAGVVSGDFWLQDVL